MQQTLKVPIKAFINQRPNVSQYFTNSINTITHVKIKHTNMQPKKNPKSNIFNDTRYVCQFSWLLFKPHANHAQNVKRNPMQMQPFFIAQRMLHFCTAMLQIIEMLLSI